MGSNPTVDKNFSFCNVRLFRAPRNSTDNTNEIKQDINPRQ